MASKTLCAVITAAILASACASAPPPGGGTAFGLMGDTPYSNGEVRALDDMITRINQENLAFVVHVGDVGTGRRACTDEWLLARREQFNRVRHPFILIPGDNDWVDCHRSGRDPLERLARFRQIFLTGDESLGQRRMKVERQSADARFTDYREHMRWTAGDALFITLNVQGSDDNLGRTPAMDAEHRKRGIAVRAWLSEAEHRVLQRKHRALVILTQANPDFEERRRARGALDPYASLRAALAVLSERVQVPVLFVHGDTHLYQQNRPLKNARGGTVSNFTRVEVFGSPFTSWLHGLIPASEGAPIWVSPAP